MTILVLSDDDEAAGALCAALTRAGQSAYHEISLAGARERAQRMAPLVVVADMAVAGHDGLISHIRAERPWTRVYLMGEPAPGSAAAPVPTVRKPFDAAEVADLLTREQELAEIDRRKRRLERELEHAERLAAIGRLAASMAHEINNPLAVIFASATYVSETAERIGDGDLAECARDLELAAQRIGSFVQHVCGFARRERPQLADAPIGVAVDMALRMIRPRVKDQAVSIVVSGARPEVRTPHDPPRVSQAIVNLLSNAVDATGVRGGRVYLTVHEDPRYLVIRVDDEGPGVDAEIADKLFQPFATTKPHGQGTGLGLAITRQIMLDHGGTVTLSGRPEGGARAELRLPKFDPTAHTVLVLDAEAAVCRALSADLRREGFCVVATGTMAQARHELASARVAVVVCDPEMRDHEDPLSELRTLAPESAILVVSAAQRDWSSAHAALGKPWERARLVAAVRELCVASLDRHPADPARAG